MLGRRQLLDWQKMTPDLGLFGPKSDKIGAYRAAFIYQGPFKKDFSTGSE
jgi:hypothetical protein